MENKAVAPTVEKKTHKVNCSIHTADGRPLREVFTFFEVNALKYAADPDFCSLSEQFTFGNAGEVFTVLLRYGDKLRLRRESNGKILEVVIGKQKKQKTPPTEKIEAIATQYGISIATAWNMWNAGALKVA